MTGVRRATRHAGGMGRGGRGRGPMGGGRGMGGQAGGMGMGMPRPAAATQRQKEYLDLDDPANQRTVLDYGDL